MWFKARRTFKFGALDLKPGDYCEIDADHPKIKQMVDLGFFKEEDPPPGAPVVKPKRQRAKKEAKTAEADQGAADGEQEAEPAGEPPGGNGGEG